MINPCARSSWLISHSRSASELKAWATLTGELAEPGAAEYLGNFESGGYLLRGRVLWQVRQVPTHPGLQLGVNIMQDLSEAVTDGVLPPAVLVRARTGHAGETEQAVAQLARQVDTGAAAGKTDGAPLLGMRGDLTPGALDEAVGNPGPLR